MVGWGLPPVVYVGWQAARGWAFGVRAPVGGVEPRFGQGHASSRLLNALLPSVLTVLVCV